MFVQDIVPARDLLTARELAPGLLRDKVVEHVVVPWLVARTKRRRTPIPGFLQVFADFAFPFDNMSVGIDCSEIAHDLLLLTFCPECPSRKLSPTTLGFDNSAVQVTMWRVSSGS